LQISSLPLRNFHQRQQPCPFRHPILAISSRVVDFPPQSIPFRRQLPSEGSAFPHMALKSVI
jgi:hypothetical protein